MDTTLFSSFQPRAVVSLCFHREYEKLLKEIPVPEFIDPVFTKTSPKRSFSLNRKRAFWLVFAKTGSIISGTAITDKVDLLNYGSGSCIIPPSPRYEGSLDSDKPVPVSGETGSALLGRSGRDSQTTPAYLYSDAKGKPKSSLRDVVVCMGD